MQPFFYLFVFYLSVRHRRARLWMVKVAPSSNRDSSAVEIDLSDGWAVNAKSVNTGYRDRFS